MKKRQGQILIQVLIMTSVIITVCLSIVTRGIHTKHMRERYINKESGAAEVDGALAKAWGCLKGSGYPGVTCAATLAQQSCVPAGVTAVFSGTPPWCTVSLSITR